MDELAILREQMASIKQSLANSRITNTQLMKKVMHHQSSWMNGTVIAEIVAVPVITACVVMLSNRVGISMWYAVSFFIIAAIDAAFDLKTFRINPRLFVELDLVSLRKTLIKQKAHRRLQFLLGSVAVTIWSVWFGVEYIMHNDKYHLSYTPSTILNVSLMIIAIVAVGILVSLLIYNRAQRTNDSIISQIDQYNDAE